MTRKRDYEIRASEIVEHGELEGLENDDHPQYMATDIAREISVQHEFNPFQVAPFKVGDDAADYLVAGLNADLLDGLEASDLAAAIHTHVKSDITDLQAISATPAATTIPLADGSGDIDAGWLPSGVLTNFDAGSPSDHQLLYFDTASGNWKNSAKWTLSDDGLFSTVGVSITGYLMKLVTSGGGAIIQMESGVNGYAGYRMKNDAQEWSFQIRTNDEFAIQNTTTSVWDVLAINTSNRVAINYDAIIAGSGKNLGFFSATGGGKQTVTGSRGGNAALASLLTALASHGLITDSST